MISANQPSLFQDSDKFFIDDAMDWRLKQFSNPNAHIRLATVFSGIGAIEQAFHRLNLNHSIVFANDIDNFVKKSYLANYQLDEKDWHSDITTFDAKPYHNQVDLLVGGSPCQAFSMVGKRLGLEDTRGTLFYDFARVVLETQPKIFIYENVKGLLNHDNGNTWQVVQDVFNSLGYQLYSQVLNSKNYGIPQHRERIFVIGFKNPPKSGFEFPQPIELEHTMQDFLEDYTDSKYFLKKKALNLSLAPKIDKNVTRKLMAILCFVKKPISNLIGMVILFLSRILLVNLMILFLMSMMLKRNIIFPKK